MPPTPSVTRDPQASARALLAWSFHGASALLILTALAMLAPCFYSLIQFLLRGAAKGFDCFFVLFALFGTIAMTMGYRFHRIARSVRRRLGAATHIAHRTASGVTQGLVILWFLIVVFTFLISLSLFDRSSTRIPNAVWIIAAAVFLPAPWIAAAAGVTRLASSLAKHDAAQHLPHAFPIEKTPP